METSTSEKNNETVIKSEPDSSTTEEENYETRQSILKLIEDLVHSLMCKNAFCSRANCRKFKWAILHSKFCTRPNGTSRCVPCRDLFMLLCFHAHICDRPETSPRCKLIGCSKTKQYLKYMRMRKQRKVKGTSSTSISFRESTDEESLPDSSTSSITTSSSLSLAANKVDVQIKVEPTSDDQ